MKLEDYLQQLPARRLSQVKRTILRVLWDSDRASFPKPWIASSVLLERTQQKYFDRRIRELRDQLGCDLETRYVADLSDHAWRLRSANLNAPKQRRYPTARQKSDLFARYGSRCAACGVTIAAGEKGLQADHKVPISRGGGSEPSNWQPLCQNCNVAKRRACQGCDLPCKTCAWAYPETVGIRTSIALREPTLRRLEAFTERTQRSRDEVVNDAVDRYLDAETSEAAPEDTDE